MNKLFTPATRPVLGFQQSYRFAGMSINVKFDRKEVFPATWMTHFAARVGWGEFVHDRVTKVLGLVASERPANRSARKRSFSDA
jgi:hypothetical protein